MDRRCFLFSMAAAGVPAVASGASRSRPVRKDQRLRGVLVDTTRCAGCRTCELECAQTNGLPEPDTEDDSVFNAERQPTENQFTVVNRFGGEDDEVFVKRQCMHCIQPACASACLTKAMLKTPEGPVIWRESKCMGCRFCMVSCPFDIPKFEYHSANPRIRKCVQCSTRIEEGKQPACVDACPNEALIFGPRHELVKEGWRRILESPDEYHGHIYGEHEVGGTGTMYLSSVPFEKLGFRADLGKVAYPEFTTGFLYSVPIILTLWPAFLLGLSNATKRNTGEEEIEVSDG